MSIIQCHNLWFSSESNANWWRCINRRRQPALVEDPLRRCPNDSHARALHEWEPRVSLDDGFGRLLKDFWNQTILKLAEFFMYTLD